MSGAHQEEPVTAVECHQALHGYSDGHELLAASLRIPRAIRSTMLLLSDLSGPSVVPGFNEYCTGYPLSSEQLYALSRTWYASEMPRPGCVWTHTLLVPIETLGRVADLIALTRAFSRPSEDDRRSVFRRYTRPLRLALELAGGANGIDQSESQLAARILAALYERPSSRVIVAADDGSRLEKLVFAIWSQQWPRLRQTFWFCTGSLGRRSAADFPFDLQVVPQALSRQFGGTSEFLVVQESSSEEMILEATDGWTSHGVADLRTGGGSALRRFLWIFGADEDKGRAAFGRLCQVHSLLELAKRDEASARKVVEYIAAMYPEPHSAAELKNACFAYPNGALGGPQRPRGEQFLVAEALLSSSHAFGSEIVSARERAMALVQLDAVEAMQLGSRVLAMGVGGGDFVSGLAQALRPEHVSSSDASDALVARLVRVNPFLATSSLVWKMSEGRQGAVVKGLKECPDLSNELMSLVIKAFIEAGANPVAIRELNAGFGDVKAHALMDWLSETTRTDAASVLSRWRHVLIGHDRAILEWIEAHSDPSPLPVLAAAVALDPSVNANELGSLFWSGSSRLPFMSFERSDGLRAAAFVLRKALESSNPAAANRISEAFSVVYDAAEQNELPGEAWSILSEVLPGSWWNWDRCERLVEGAVKTFARCRWPSQEFVRTFAKPELLERALHVAKWSWEGAEYRREVCRAFGEGGLEVSEGQAKALRSSCY